MPERLYMLDTDTMVFLIRGSKSTCRDADRVACAKRIRGRVQKAQKAGAAVGISAVTVSELEYGAERSDDPARERRAVSKILAPFELLEYDATLAPRSYGQVRAALESVGRPIGSMDLLIAAHALSLGAVLVTHNVKEFGRVEGLVCEDWT